MSKYNIKCIARSGEEDEFVITADSKVWPCCMYASAEINPSCPPEDVNLDDDIYIATLMINDPDWNNCDVRDVSDIMEHDFFTKHISQENWNSDTPPNMCVACCHHEE